MLRTIKGPWTDHQVKVLVTNPDNLRLITETHKVEGDMCQGAQVCVPANTVSKNVG